MKSFLVTLFLFTAPLLFAQSEFIVNTVQDSTQRDPQIERDGSGNVLIVWAALNHAGAGTEGDIVMQRFTSGGDAVGGEIPVNTLTRGDQERPASAMNASGALVVAWASLTSVDSAYEIKARRFIVASPSGGEFLVNTTVSGTQTEPDVAVSPTGRSVIAWNSWTPSDDRDVFMRFYAVDGTPATDEIRINTTTAYSQAKPAVEFRPDGSIVAVWESWGQDAAGGYGVYARLFDSTGTPLGGEIPVNTYTADYQWYADVATFSDNSFAIVWCSWEQDGADGSIVLQRFDSDGAKIGSEQIINTTTAQYQWLPRIRKFADDGFAVAWSSWKQDGNREGVYTRLFDRSGRATSFETPCNTTTESFQWEPDVVTFDSHVLMVVWSSWGQTGKDYEVVGRIVTPSHPQGYLGAGMLTHPAGRTTSRVTVHVLDSLALTGQTYTATFDSLSGTTAALSVRNMSTGDTLVRNFPIDRGEGVFYLTPVFEGVALEVIPEFDLGLDFTRSYMVNRSGTNLTFTLNIPSSGSRKFAPIDVALIWGSTDTLADGTYRTVLDTALGTTGKREIAVPFIGWNLTDDKRMDLLVVESVINKQWTVGERIVFLTPVPYRTASNNTHAEIRPTAPQGSVFMPAAGDTNVVLTTRPIAQGEEFVFTTSRDGVLDVPVVQGRAGGFRLEQNYPNPFNPSSTIRYSVGKTAYVAMHVYNILGQHVATLVDAIHQPGDYRIRFNGEGLSSGVYFYRMEWEGRAVTQRMLLVR
jgi:hypothetical protein